MEKNFHEFEPIVDKIGAGFGDSYHRAKEKASRELGSETDLTQLKSDDAENKLTFFNGLDKKVEQENKKLLKLHEYLHSNIEKLDYGADILSCTVQMALACMILRRKSYLGLMLTTKPTVIEKGQLQLNVDQTLEEVDSRDWKQDLP
ncbi:hypothetical protein AAHA92_17810 [Salvia divinorum]|uniref:Uncharacterized protein n=1 Tax=Salvia divinorum TaxID=28513 RepID=A0ABD1GZZ7_SALDI